MQNDLKMGACPELANLNKKRVVITSEPTADVTIKTATMKKITGGQNLTARALYSNKTTTDLQCTLIMECNNKPNLDEVGEAIERRLIEIPFKIKYSSQEDYDTLSEEVKKVVKKADSSLKSKTFQKQHKQALFMIVSKYFKEYHTKGFVLPECIKALNKQYLEMSDNLNQWVQENCKKADKNECEKLKTLFALYKYSDQFKNCSKEEKRRNNYKTFCTKMETNYVLKNNVYDDRHQVKCLWGWKIRCDNDDDDN